MGIRMRLRELKDMAHAGQEGTLLEATLTRLRKEAKGILLDSGTLLPKRFKLVAAQVGQALTAVPDEPDQFLPGGRNYATVVAALQFLDEEVDLIHLIADELDTQARAAYDWKRLVGLDTLVMLLDDELAYLGHSMSWRGQVATAVADDVAKGTGLAEAIAEQVGKSQASCPRDIQWLFPVARLKPCEENVLTNRLRDAQLVEEVLLAWPDLPDGDIRYDNGAFEISARSSSRGAALADLWTVAEAVFAGSAAESSAGAGEVMAGIAQVSYPRELLRWFSDRFDELSLSCGQRRPTERPEDWALAVFEAHALELFRAVESDPVHSVLYVRCKAFSAWSRSSQMEEDLAELGRRMRRVAERAYLVRNFFVHSAQPYRATALRVTLPPFAELMRVCLGVLTADNRRINDPIQAAKLATMRVAWVAERYADEKTGDPGPLRSYVNA